MRIAGKRAAAGISAAAVLAAVLGLGGLAYASSEGRQAPPVRLSAAASTSVQFKFAIKDLPAAHTVEVSQSSLAFEETESLALVGYGIGTALSKPNTFSVSATAGNTLNGYVEVDVLAGESPLTGKITFPAGTTVTVTNTTTGQTIQLTPGPFSIPTGVTSAVSSSPGASTSVPVTG